MLSERVRRILFYAMIPGVIFICAYNLFTLLVAAWNWFAAQPMLEQCLILFYISWAGFMIVVLWRLTRWQ